MQFSNNMQCASNFAGLQYVSVDFRTSYRAIVQACALADPHVLSLLSLSRKAMIQQKFYPHPLLWQAMVQQKFSMFHQTPSDVLVPGLLALQKF